MALPRKRADLEAALKDLNVEVPKDAKVPDLQELLKEALAKADAENNTEVPPPADDAQPPVEVVPDAPAQEEPKPEEPEPAPKVASSEYFTVVELNGRYYRKWHRKNGTTDMEFIGLEPPK